jgi:hypothetical protein
MDDHQKYFHLAYEDHFKDYYSFKKFICQNVICSKEYTLSNTDPGMTKNCCSIECLTECNSAKLHSAKSNSKK